MYTRVETSGPSRFDEGVVPNHKWGVGASGAVSAWGRDAFGVCERSNGIQPRLRDVETLATSLRNRHDKPSLLFRGTIVNRTYGAHKTLYISLFVLTIFGPI